MSGFFASGLIRSGNPAAASLKRFYSAIYESGIRFHANRDKRIDSFYEGKKYSLNDLVESFDSNFKPEVVLALVCNLIPFYLIAFLVIIIKLIIKRKLRKSSPKVVIESEPNRAEPGTIPDSEPTIAADNQRRLPSP